MSMKSTAPTTTRVTLLLLTTAVLVTISQSVMRNGPAVPPAVGIAANEIESAPEASSVADVDVQLKYVQPSVATIPAAPTAVAAPLDAVRAEMANDAELAYQLGEDISKLSPEALAQMRTDWETHVRQSQAEAALAE